MGSNSIHCFAYLCFALTLVSDPNPIENTLNQSVGEQMRAEELSLRATTPPAQVPGYRLDRLLGQGAFGQVWVGNNLNTGRTVAIKFYLHRSGVNWPSLTREVKNLVSMAGNRFIVQVLEVGWDAEPPYYVMEYLENGSLDDLIRARGAMPPSKAIELFSDIAMGLNHSHGKGVLHCDLKPANVLLDQDWLPKLADFGQSRLSNEQTPSLGTLFYMAPEQADLNALPDARWDVYALGAIFYCMIVGSPPYKTPDTVSTLDTAASLPERLKRYRDTIFKSHFPRAHHRVRGMDRWLLAIVDRCIAKKPEDRFANVQQVLAAIERRQMARLRRPLMLLGIVGPILLLAVMGLFAWHGVFVAKESASEQLRKWVWQSNLFAAKFAARTLESEMASLFKLIEEDARRGDLEERFLACVDEATEEFLGNLAKDRAPADSQGRAMLEGFASRIKLEQYLEERLSEIKLHIGSSKKPARFDSMFVTDRFGTILAGAFTSDLVANPIGSNVAFRSYFSGQSLDLDEKTPVKNIPRTTSSQVSVPFTSKTTNRNKIAISTPISVSRKVPSRGDEKPPTDSSQNDEKESETNDDLDAKKLSETKGAEDEQVIEGVLVLTINIGDFELLSEDDEKDPHDGRFAVLVDGHVGTSEGAILQHPIFSKTSRQEVKQYQIDAQIDAKMLKTLQDQDDETLQYVDPVSTDPQGKEYGGKWIAAMQRVDISKRGSDSRERKQSTDLWVLVQERADSITAPVQSMVSSLINEGIFALFVLLTVVSVLWVVVLWVMRLPDSFASAMRSRGSSGNEMTGTANEATLDAEH
jgi:eukaryotic-like serine/threonine-protein kinase